MMFIVYLLKKIYLMKTIVLLIKILLKKAVVLMVKLKMTHQKVQDFHLVLNLGMTDQSKNWINIFKERMAM